MAQDREVRRRWRLRLADGIVMLVCATVVCGLSGVSAVTALRHTSRLVEQGVAVDASVTGMGADDVQGSSTICVTYLFGGSTVDTCVPVLDPTSLDPADQVTVLVDPADPRVGVIDGNTPLPGRALTWFFLLGLPLLAGGLWQLVDALDRRARRNQLRASWWVLLTSLLGLSTWLAFLYVGWRGRRWRWRIWAGLYLVATVAAVVLGPLMDPAHHRADLGLALLAAVWVGGVVHAMVVRTRACDAIVSADPRHGPKDAVVVSLAEMPWVPAAGPGGSTDEVEGLARGVVLHARRPEGGPLCVPPGAELVGTLVPTFQRWPSGRPNHTERCQACERLAPTGSDDGPSRRDGTRPLHLGVTWEYRDGRRMLARYLGYAYLPLLAWWLIPVQIAVLRAPGADRRVGLAFLVVTTVPVVWFLWRATRARTIVGADGLELHGILRRRRVPWSDIESFGVAGGKDSFERATVQLIGGRRLTMAGLSAVGVERGAVQSRVKALDAAFGLTPVTVTTTMALAELPWRLDGDGHLIREDLGAVVLHAAGAHQWAGCLEPGAELSGTVVPTFEGWPGGPTNRFILCPDCRRGRPPGADRWAQAPELDERPAQDGWLYRDRRRTGRAWVVAYVFLVAWWLVPLQVLAFRTGAAARWWGPTFLLATTAPLVWFAWRSVRSATVLGPDGVVTKGLWRDRSVGWAQARFFAADWGRVVVEVDGASPAVLSGLRPVGVRSNAEHRAMALNRALGLGSAERRFPGLVELPWRLGADRVASVSTGGRGVVLHAAGGEGQPLCVAPGSPMAGTLVPSFQRWPAGRPNRYDLCPDCLRVAPIRSADPEPSAGPPSLTWTYASRGRVVGLLVVAYVLGVMWWLVPLQIGLAVEPGGRWWVSVLFVVATTAPLAWVAWRAIRASSTVGPDHLELRGFWRTGTLPWTEITSFAVSSRAGSKRVVVEFEGAWESIMPGLGLVGTDRGRLQERADQLDRALGGSRRGPDRACPSLVELPRAADGAPAVLHAASPSGGARCGPTVGPLVPTFEAWATGDHRRSPRCAACAQLCPPAQVRHWCPSPPRPYRAARASVGHWQYLNPETRRATAWVLLLFGLVLWPPYFWSRTEVSAEEIVIVDGVGRRRQLPWSQTRGFDVLDGADTGPLVIVTRSNEQLRVTRPLAARGPEGRQRAAVLNDAFELGRT